MRTVIRQGFAALAGLSMIGAAPPPVAPDVPPPSRRVTDGEATPAACAPLGFDLTPPVEVKRLLKEVGKDKKNEDGMLRIVLPVGIGDCEVRPMTMDAFAALF